MDVPKYLSSGSTLLNLGLTGRHDAGLMLGKYYFLVGDSSSGKTLFSSTILAEACIKPVFKEYRLIYDDVEGGNLFDLERLFGDDLADRIEPPELNKDKEAVHSDTVESFYIHLDDAVDAGKPFIYILDSADGLTSEQSDDKFDQMKDAYRKGKMGDLPGSYGDGKAKKNSEYLRRAMKGLRESNSILIVLSQTRDNITGYGASRTRSGGRALRFYATAEIWTGVVGDIKKTVNGHERKIGRRVRLKIEKNRLNGRLSEVDVDLYPEVGIDDLGSCVDFLHDEGVITDDKMSWVYEPLKLKGRKENFIAVIEERGLETEIRKLCEETWKKIEAECAIRRKNRYASEK